MEIKAKHWASRSEHTVTVRDAVELGLFSVGDLVELTQGAGPYRDFEELPK